MPTDTGEPVGDAFTAIIGVIGGVGFDTLLLGLVTWGVYAIFTGRLVTRREHENTREENDRLRDLVRQREATISELLPTAQVVRAVFAALPEAASVLRDETPT